MNEREFDELAAGHALHALRAEDERAFREAVARDDERALRAEQDAETAAQLAGLVAEIAPPPRIRSELLARIASEGAAQSPVAEDAPHAAAGDRRTDVPPARGWGRRAWFTLAASVVLLGAVGAGAGVIAQWGAPPPAVVALERIEDAPDARSAEADLAGGGAATVHWSAALGEAVLVSENLPRIADDRQFELWYVRGEEAVPAGVFDASASGTTAALLDEGMQPGDVIAVTVEQSGGSPSGRPTSAPIVVIQTS